MHLHKWKKYGVFGQARVCQKCKVVQVRDTAISRWTTLEGNALKEWISEEKKLEDGYELAESDAQQTEKDKP